jgi:hypothetical protein
VVDRNVLQRGKLIIKQGGGAHTLLVAGGLLGTSVSWFIDEIVLRGFLSPCMFSYLAHPRPVLRLEETGYAKKT